MPLRALFKEFSSPASPTGGLAAYSLERGVKVLHPYGGASLRARVPRKFRLRAKFQLIKGALLKAVTTDQAAHEAATSYLNLKLQPTEEQKNAGNYPKGHVEISGLDVSIENPAGSHRRPDWPPLASHYGYIRRTEGADGEHMDAFIRNGTPPAYYGPVFVIDQYARGKFDEHKVMLGWPNEESARSAYLSNYASGWQGAHCIREMGLPEFKAWLQGGDTSAELGSATEIERMAEYIANALAAYSRGRGALLKALLKGDVEGHEFHGNQYTGGYGGGAKPEGDKPKAASIEAQAKGTRAAVHELLSSGHAFTFQELKDITGSKDKALSNVLSTLKNPKWAGPDGTLSVVKEGKFFYVKKEEIGPGKPSATLKPELVGKPFVAAWPDQTGKPVAAAKPELAGIGKVAGGGVTVKAPAEVMEKAKADEIYQSKLEAAGMTLTEQAGQLDDPSKGILDFKIARNEAMAEWKANTTGKDQVTVEQKVYAADLKLYEALANAEGEIKDEFKTAFSQWKNDTAAEKAGMFGAKPEAAQEKPAAAGPVPTTKGEALAPIPDSAHLSAKDFAGEEGTKSQFEKDLASTAKAFKEGSAKGDSTANKIEVQHALEAQLKGSAAFAAVQKDNPDAVRQLVGQWAGTSNDHDSLAVAMQLAVRDEFGMKASDVDMNRGNDHINSAGSEANVYATAASHFGFEGDVATFRQAMMDFQRAQYDNTQAYLKSQGIKEVALMRGMKLGSGSAEAAIMPLKLQPASSFTYAAPTAQNFSGGHSIFLVRVPASQVLGSYKTGYGCTNESEIVLLAHPNTTSIRIGAQHAASNTSKTVASVRQHMKTWEKLMKALAPFCIDGQGDSADWIKQAWDLPPYKSREFLQIFSDLNHFRELPVYKAAVESGLIMDDEWMGDDISAPTVRRGGAQLKAVPPPTNEPGG